jgi:hypothetical protein
MVESEDAEKTLSLQGFPDEGIICPFSRGKWKKVGDALVLLWLIVMPILYIVFFLTT